MVIIKLALSILLALAAVEARKECVSRPGKDTIVCVCDSSHCDDLTPLIKQKTGSAFVVETSKGGHRFKESVLNFSSNGSQANTIVLTVDHNEKHLKWFGLGAAFTDAAVINIDSLPKELAEHVVRDYFANTGVEFSLARIPIAGTDFSTRFYTYDDSTQPDFELKNWKLQDEDIKHKIPNIKLAQSVSPHKIKLFGTPWNNPSWLGGPDLKTHREKHLTTYANYLVKYNIQCTSNLKFYHARFLDAYKQNGIDIWGMTMMNEPYSPQQPDNMNFKDVTVEHDLVKLLGPALAKAGYTRDKFNLMVYDDGSADNPVLKYVETMLDDPNAHKYINGIAYHCYLAGGLNWTAEIHKKYPEQFVLMSECCQNFRPDKEDPHPIGLGEWSAAEGYTKAVINNIVNNVQGWTEWNLALDTMGHPHRQQKHANAPVVVDSQKKEYLKNPQFYALGHFSKFIAPESQRIAVKASKTQNNLEFVAFDRPDGATAVIVANYNNNPIDFVLSDATHGKLTTKISENAIQSFIYWK